MTDREFKRLSRSQLIDIIYQLQLKQEEINAENQRLSSELADKRILVTNAGSLADAALEIHNVMQSAQNAAEHFLEEIQLRINDEYQRILQETNAEAAAIISQATREAENIIAKAKQEAANIVLQARSENPDFDPVVEAILREYGYDQFSGSGDDLLREYDCDEFDAGDYL